MKQSVLRTSKALQKFDFLIEYVIIITAILKNINHTSF